MQGEFDENYDHYDDGSLEGHADGEMSDGEIMGEDADELNK